MRSPAIDLTAFTSGVLQFKQFNDIEPIYDWGSINILSAATGNIIAVLNPTVGGNFTDWQSYAKDLPTAAFAEPISIEFRLRTDDYNAAPFSGWYIDDVAIVVSGS